MPTYEYACRQCGEHLEVVQSFKDDALTECPGCQGQLRKVYSAAGLIFKGSGWHVKDYAASSRSSTSSSSAKGEGTSSSSSTSDSGSTSSSAGSSSGSSSSSSSEGASKSA
jgi:putative FmdB family regulatory protein